LFTLVSRCLPFFVFTPLGKFLYIHYNCLVRLSYYKIVNKSLLNGWANKWHREFKGNSFQFVFFFFFKFVFLDSVLSISTRRGLRERSRVGVRKPKVISHFPVMEL
jgi:hypothetical protein